MGKNNRNLKQYRASVRRFIREYVKENGTEPTIDCIQRSVASSLSLSEVQQVLEDLKNEDLVRCCAEKDRREKVLTFIRVFIINKHFSPTVREIQEGVNPRISSPSIVQGDLITLEGDGFLTWNKKRPRTIQLTERGGDTLFRIPLASSPVAAGYPIPVLADLVANKNLESLTVSTHQLGEFVKNAHLLFAMHVDGRSMIDALIDHGDILIVHPQETAEIGQTIIAWLVEQKTATVKKFYRESDNLIRLQPANTAFPPIYCSADNVEIKGRVIGVIRTAT